MAEEASVLPPWMKVLGTLVLTAFLANGAMVWLSLRGHRDLVRSDYYQAGLAQDARMARRALADSQGISLSTGAADWIVRVESRDSAAYEGSAAAVAAGLPGSLCRVRFSRPDDGREDRSVELAWGGNGNSSWQGPGVPLRAGQWDVLIEWEKDGKVFMESAFPRYVNE